MFVQPYTDEELMGITFVEGDATGVIKSATLEISKKTKEPMVKIVNTIWDQNDNEIIINDYINLSLRWKFAQLFKAINLTGKLKEGYHTDDLPDLLNGRAFKCNIGLVPDKDNPLKKYMRIKFYIEHVPDEEAQGMVPFNDDLDFKL